MERDNYNMRNGAIDMYNDHLHLPATVLLLSQSNVDSGLIDRWSIFVHLKYSN